MCCELTHIYPHTVPTPTAGLGVPSGPLYEGTSQTLTCNVTLPDTVDTDVTVTVQLVKGITTITTSGRVTISPVASLRSAFISTLTFTPLIMTDAGQYYCEATADSSSQYITTSTPGQSTEKTITVTGMS